MAAVLASGSYMARFVTKERIVLTSSGQRSKNRWMSPPGRTFGVGQPDNLHSNGIL